MVGGSEKESTASAPTPKFNCGQRGQGSGMKMKKSVLDRGNTTKIRNLGLRSRQREGNNKEQGEGWPGRGCLRGEHIISSNLLLA